MSHKKKDETDSASRDAGTFFSSVSNVVNVHNMPGVHLWDKNHKKWFYDCKGIGAEHSCVGDTFSTRIKKQNNNLDSRNNVESGYEVRGICADGTKPENTPSKRKVLVRC